MINLIEFKIMVIKKLTEVRRPMHEQSKNLNKETKYKKYQADNRVEYKNWTEKFYRQVQHQTIEGGRKDKHTWRLVSGIHPIKGAKRKKSKDSLRDLWDNIKHTIYA